MLLVWENSYQNQEETQILHEPQACVVAAVAEAALQGLHHPAEVVPEEQLRSLMAPTTPNLPNTPDPRRDVRIKNPRKGRRRVPMRRRPPEEIDAGERSPASVPQSPGASCRRLLVHHVATAAWPSCAAPLPLPVRSPSDGISSTPVEAGRHSWAGVTGKGRGRPGYSPRRA